jgi:hypothetical protein
MSAKAGGCKSALPSPLVHHLHKIRKQIMRIVRPR